MTARTGICENYNADPITTFIQPNFEAPPIRNTRPCRSPQISLVLDWALPSTSHIFLTPQKKMKSRLRHFSTWNTRRTRWSLQSLPFPYHGNDLQRPDSFVEPGPQAKGSLKQCCFIKCPYDQLFIMRKEIFVNAQNIVPLTKASEWWEKSFLTT